MSATTPRDSSISTSDDDSEPSIAPEDIYLDLIDACHAICLFCYRWRLPRWRAAAGEVEVAGMTPEIDPSDVADTEQVYPPRVPRPTGAHQNQPDNDDTPLERYRACQPVATACECGDVDADALQTRSKDKALSLVEQLARRIGEFGYVYALDTLYERVEAGKSDPAIQGDDDLVFQVAVAAAVVDARGGDVEAVVEEVLND